MPVTFCIGVFLWLVYGILLGAVPMILANVVTLAPAGLIPALTLRDGDEESCATGTNGEEGTVRGGPLQLRRALPRRRSAGPELGLTCPSDRPQVLQWAVRPLTG